MIWLNSLDWDIYLWYRMEQGVNTNDIPDVQLYLFRVYLDEAG